jgi:hypothetical protein
MTHSVQLVIGRGEAVARFVRAWPGARAVELKGGWMAIPLVEAVYDAIEAKTPDASRSPELDLSPLGLGQAMAGATQAGGGLAYVETDYWGGQGGQSAMAYIDGRETMAPQRSRGGGGPINQSLRTIGVIRNGELDEFDTIGLGYRRTMADYEVEGPVRLRGHAAPAPPQATEKRSLPIWLAVLVIVAAIAGGIFMGMAR